MSLLLSNITYNYMFRSLKYKLFTKRNQVNLIIDINHRQVKLNGIYKNKSIFPEEYNNFGITKDPDAVCCKRISLNVCVI